MRVLVCGGRNYGWVDKKSHIGFNHEEYDLMEWELNCITNPEHGGKWSFEMICGMAFGADTMAYNWAKRHGVKVHEYPADWEKYGKRAGYIRNKQMLEEGKPDLVVAFPGGKGTAMMVNLARQAGVRVIEISHPEHRSERTDT